MRHFITENWPVSLIPFLLLMAFHWKHPFPDHWKNNQFRFTSWWIIDHIYIYIYIYIDNCVEDELYLRTLQRKLHQTHVYVALHLSWKRLTLKNPNFFSVPITLLTLCIHKIFLEKYIVMWSRVLLDTDQT